MKLKLAVYVSALFLAGTFLGGFVSEKTGNGYIGAAATTASFLAMTFFFGVIEGRKKARLEEGLKNLSSEMERVEGDLKQQLESFEDPEDGE